MVRTKSDVVRLKGLDVNEMAIKAARTKNPSIAFEISDATRWTEPPKSWDAILTMSLLDHIPDEAVDRLAEHMIATAKSYIICVELWDGRDGTRAKYKYSRDLRSVFEPRGIRTLCWQRAVGQYDEKSSQLWSYIGQIG